MNIKSFIIISLSLTANIFASQELPDNILYKWKNNQFVQIEQNEEKCSVDTITLVPTYKNFKYNRDLILSNVASAEADKEHSHILHLRIDDDIEDIKEEILSIDEVLKEVTMPKNFGVNIIINGKNEGIYKTRINLVKDILDYYDPSLVTFMDADDLKQKSYDKIIRRFMDNNENCKILYPERTEALVLEKFSFAKVPDVLYEPEIFKISPISEYDRKVECLELPEGYYTESCIEAFVPITLKYDSNAWKGMYEKCFRDVTYQDVALHSICSAYARPEGFGCDASIGYVLDFDSDNKVPLSFYRQHENSDLHRYVIESLTITDNYNINECLEYIKFFQGKLNEYSDFKLIMIKEEILEKLTVLHSKVENEEDNETIKKTMDKIDAIKEPDKGYLIIGDDE